MNSASGCEEHLLADKSWNPLKASLIEPSNGETEASSCNGGFLQHSEWVSPHVCVLGGHWGWVFHPDTHEHKPQNCNFPSSFSGEFTGSPRRALPLGIHL